MTTERLEAARRALRDLDAEDAALVQRLTDLQRQAAPARTAAANADSIRQQRRGLFARLFRLGSSDPDADAELNDLDTREAAAAREAVRAQAASEAAAEIEAEISAQRVQLVQRRQALLRELHEAAAEAAHLEADQQHLPELIAALGALKTALGKAYGAQLAADRLTDQVRGLSGAYRVEAYAPMRELQVNLPGMQMEQRLRGRTDVRGSSFSVVNLDFGPGIDSTAAEIVARLTSTTPSTNTDPQQRAMRARAAA